LLVAIGAAWFDPLAAIGGALWAIPLVRLGASWLKLYRTEILALHGAAPLLAAALAGLAISMLFGTAAVALPAFTPRRHLSTASCCRWFPARPASCCRSG